MRRAVAIVLALIAALCSAVSQAAPETGETYQTVRADAVYGSVYRITVSGAENASVVQISAYSAVNGPDDRVRYNAGRNEDGTWTALVNSSRHGGGSMVSSVNVDGALYGEVTYEAPVPAYPGILAIHRIGSFYSVVVSNVKDAQTVRIPTWTRAHGQDDIVWYEAKNRGGVWSVNIDTARHGGGELISHVYCDSRYVGNVSYTAPVVQTEAHAVFRAGTRYSVIVGNIWGANEVSVPTWGTVGGQDDIIWYSAKQISPSAWQADINAASHDEGIIQSDVYVDGKNIGESVTAERSGLGIAVGNTTQTVSPDLSVYSRKRIGWGHGGPRDVSGRPESADTYQSRYGSLSADFIGPHNSNIYLTFDEGYEAGYTSAILDTLLEKNVKAVFFVTAPYVKENPELVRRIIDEGHRLGNHSVHHQSFPGLSDEKAVREVMDLHRMVQEQFGYEMTLFRFPEGVFSERDLQILKSLGYRSVFWSFAYADWDQNKQPGYSYALRKTTGELHPGAVYLLHAVSRDNASILGDFIDTCRVRGYTLAEYDLDVM